MDGKRTSLPSKPMAHESEPSNLTRNRWVQIKRLTLTQIREIQEAETAAYQRFLWEAVAFGEGGPQTRTDWQMVGMSRLATFNDALGPFWPARSPLDWRERETRLFHRHIFRLWRSLWDRYDTAWDKMPGEVGYLSEVTVIHQCDIAISKDPYPFPPASVAGASSSGMNSFKSKPEEDQKEDWWDK